MGALQMVSQYGVFCFVYHNQLIGSRGVKWHVEHGMISNNSIKLQSTLSLCLVTVTHHCIDIGIVIVSA